ncbi:MAG: hypothetical protein Q8K92_15510 [Leadbetterella sp.]|nr:hypothetical protein [Leadbetterella sp.]
MAKFIKRTSNTRWSVFKETKGDAIREILSEEIDCLSAEIEQEISVENHLLKECTTKFKNLEAILGSEKINMQRAGYFEKSQIQSILDDTSVKYLRIYNGIYENNHFIFIAAIDENYKVTSDINILCTRIPPCPPPPIPNPNRPSEDIEDIFYEK